MVRGEVCDCQSWCRKKIQLKFRKTRLNDFFHYLLSILGSKCIFYEIVEERTPKYNLSEGLCSHGHH